MKNCERTENCKQYVVITILFIHAIIFVIFQKKENQPKNVLIYDLETFNWDKAVPYTVAFYSVLKMFWKCDRDLTEEEVQICENDALVMEGEDCISQMFE